ncbi:MAG: CsgG/HfaB family protein [Spirochaetaceae bacterium]|nr:CsgG/HfaB family protein [Spirochaetaceae bacterium]MCF7947209.1 CsgG/HfaB family protein [Spirochaetia bacterium]MCF7950248.1 CsgG/HfaB family protein [Spirochaetaceae bacterium]
MKKLLFLLSVSVFVGACTTAPPYQAESGGQRPQDVSGIRYVEIIGSNSNIVIKGDQQPEVILYDTPQVYERDEETLYLEVDSAENFRLKVPRNAYVYVENSNGTLLFSDVIGNIEADLTNTEVFVINAGEKLEIETTNGPINIVKRSGLIVDYSAVSTNADIHAIIPPENLNINLEASSGYFNINNLPVTLVERDAEEFIGYIGSEDSGILELETTNGTITLEPVGIKSDAHMLATGVTSGYQEILKRRVTQFIGTVNENFAATLRGILEELEPASASESKLTSVSPQSGAGSTDGLTGPSNPSVDSKNVQAKAAIVPLKTVVFPFVETNPPAKELGLGPALSEMLITAIANSPAVTVIERSRINSILEESEYQLSGFTSTEESIEIGNLLNSEIIIVGSVSRFGQRIELDARVIRLETGEVLFTQYGSSPEDKLRGMVNTLGKDISTSITDISFE